MSIQKKAKIRRKLPGWKTVDSDFDRYKVFELRDGEYLKEISGTYGPYMDVAQCITSLKFITSTRRASQVYGKANGEAFKIPVSQESKIVAFFGSAGDVLDALGLYVLP